MTRTSDVITTERQLRNILGLPPADNRRIIPVTPPTEARLEPDWEVARRPCSSFSRISSRRKPGRSRPTAGTDWPARSPAAMPSRNGCSVVTRRLTHSPGSSWKSTPITSSSRRPRGCEAAAAQRLDAQRAYYEEGRITIDRFLDAVSQYATAVATEAQYKTTYNISIVALEEAKGTLLEYDKITVVDSPPSKGSAAPASRPDLHPYQSMPRRPSAPRLPTPPMSPARTPLVRRMAFPRARPSRSTSSMPRRPLRPRFPSPPMSLARTPPLRRKARALLACVTTGTRAKL